MARLHTVSRDVVQRLRGLLAHPNNATGILWIDRARAAVQRIGKHHLRWTIDLTWYPLDAVSRRELNAVLDTLEGDERLLAYYARGITEHIHALLHDEQTEEATTAFELAHSLGVLPHGIANALRRSVTIQRIRENLPVCQLPLQELRKEWKESTPVGQSTSRSGEEPPKKQRRKRIATRSAEAHVEPGGSDADADSPVQQTVDMAETTVDDSAATHVDPPIAADGIHDVDQQEFLPLTEVGANDGDGDIAEAAPLLQQDSAELPGVVTPQALPQLPGDLPPFSQPNFERLVRHTKFDASTLTERELRMLALLFEFPGSLVSPSSMMNAMRCDAREALAMARGLERRFFALGGMHLFFDEKSGFALMGKIPGENPA